MCKKILNLFFCFLFFVSGFQAQSHSIDSPGELAEVNQLVNVALSLTSYAKEKNYSLTQNSQYNQKVQDWFDEYKDYVVIRDFNKLLQQDASAFQELKTDSSAYAFKNNKLVRKNGKTTESNRLNQFIPQLEVFAISSNFRKFYKKVYKKNQQKLFSESRKSFQTLNIMDDFWGFWKKAENFDLPAKAKLYREMVIKPLQQIFEGFTGKQTDEELAGYIKAVTPLVPKMRKIDEKLKKELPEAVENFKKTFPDFDWQGTAVFMPNYASFDSGGGLINGKAYQAFGVDYFALEYSEEVDLTVLFSHELFHLYHGKFHPEWNGKNREKGEIPLYWMVWNEGLATYASQKLNPNATIGEVFLNQRTETASSKIIPKLSKIILDNFESGDAKIWQPFMASSKLSDEIPPRSGYYIGYRIAEELGKKKSLRELTQLNGEGLQNKMKDVLQKFAKEVK